MTSNEARKILGKKHENITDEELQKEIEMAEFLSEIMIKLYLENKKISKLTPEEKELNKIAFKDTKDQLCYY